MTKLKLGAPVDDKPVRLSVELPAAVHRDLLAYAEVLGRETGTGVEAPKIVAPMLARFMATDREFARLRKANCPERTRRRPPAHPRRGLDPPQAPSPAASTRTGHGRDCRCPRARPR